MTAGSSRLVRQAVSAASAFRILPSIAFHSRCSRYDNLCLGEDPLRWLSAVADVEDGLAGFCAGGAK